MRARQTWWPERDPKIIVKSPTLLCFCKHAYSKVEGREEIARKITGWLAWRRKRRQADRLSQNEGEGNNRCPKVATHGSQHTCTFSYTNTQRKGGRGKKVLLFERETYDFHYTDGGKLNAFTKTWTEKSMPTFSAHYPTQLCLIAHSCRQYTTWLPNMTWGVEGGF